MSQAEEDDVVQTELDRFRESLVSSETEPVDQTKTEEAGRPKTPQRKGMFIGLPSSRRGKPRPTTEIKKEGSRTNNVYTINKDK